MPAERQYRAARIGITTGAWIIAMSTFFTGGVLAGGMDVGHAAAAAVIGQLFLGGIGFLTALAGARLRLTTAMIARRVYGEMGGRAGALGIGFVLGVDWFAWQLSFFGQTIATSFGGHTLTGAVPAMIWGAVVTTITVLFGFRLLSTVSAFAVPAILMLSFYGFALSIGRSGGVDALLASRGSGQPIGLVIGNGVVETVMFPIRYQCVRTGAGGRRDRRAAVPYPERRNADGDGNRAALSGHHLLLRTDQFDAWRRAPVGNRRLHRRRYRRDDRGRRHPRRRLSPAGRYACRDRRRAHKFPDAGPAAAGDRWRQPCRAGRTAGGTGKRRLPPSEAALVFGGGAILIDGELPGFGPVVRPPYADVANAVGAAVAQVGGEVDRMMRLEGQDRDAALHACAEEARAIASGADPSTTVLVDLDETPLAYLPGDCVRVRAKAVGDLVLPATGE